MNKEGINFGVAEMCILRDSREVSVSHFCVSETSTKSESALNIGTPVQARMHAASPYLSGKVYVNPLILHEILIRRHRSLKQQVSPGVIAAIIVVAVLLLGYFGWKSLAGPGKATDNPYQGTGAPPGGGPPSSVGGGGAPGGAPGGGTMGGPGGYPGGGTMGGPGGYPGGGTMGTP